MSRVTLERAVVSRTRVATLKFALDRASTVRITAMRKTGQRYRAAGTVSLRAAPGATRHFVRRRFGSKTLRPGRYQLKVVAIDGTLKSRTYTLPFTVR